jgi:predicted GNAT superfamily acetyltransferase
MNPLTYRDLVTDDDYHACIDLQRATWNAGDGELVPVPLLRLARRIGGVAIGAFDAADRLIGFVFGLPGIRDGQLMHWSDLLAVRTTARGLGIGQALKMHQRARVRALGISHLLWTFDPLIARNAHFNFETLGVTAVEYVRNMYGAPEGNPWQLGFATDRLIVSWDATPTERADGARADAPDEIVPLNAPQRDAVGQFRPPSTSREARRVAILLPRDAMGLERDQPLTVRQWRKSTGEAFAWALTAGYRVTRFHRAWTADLAAYVLTRETSHARPR